MAPRTRSNPLALAVLTSLYEKPMHPYEISQTLRSRGVDESVRLNFGSLYGVVAGLERRRLIEAVETVREGRRPERTVYAITDRGTTEMNEWLADLLAVPVKEYLQFEAGLALLGALPPDEVVALLRQRCERLELRLDQTEALLTSVRKRGVPRLFLLEGEYQVVLQKAELEWARLLIADMESGELDGLEQWRAWHLSGGHDRQTRQTDLSGPSDLSDLSGPGDPNGLDKATESLPDSRPAPSQGPSDEPSEEGQEDHR